MKNPSPSLLYLACLAMMVCGCNAQLRTDYGVSEGNVARESPASVFLFRNMCESEGHQTVLVRSLSPRALNKLNSIVWTPDHFGEHREATYKWIDQWLSTGGKTLVYVGRDFSPVADYWTQVADRASSRANAIEYAQALQSRAEEQAELDRNRFKVRARIATPWFLLDHTNAQEVRIQKLKGPWADGIDPNTVRFFLRSYAIGLQTFSKAELKKQFENPNQGATTKTASAVEFESKWQPEDETMLDVVTGLVDEDLPTAVNLLETDDGKPLVAQVTTQRWGSSQVVLLANASLLSNLSLVNSGNRTLARKLLELLPQQGVGFLAGSQDPPVREDNGPEQQKGFEMLTIWPLNVISIHALFFGMLILLAVFPIFGRAKRLPQKSTRDFGQHVEAVGNLLLKSQDRFYALATIADYFRNVRNEPTSPWANIDPTVQQEPKSPFSS